MDKLDLGHLKQGSKRPEKYNEWTTILDDININMMKLLQQKRRYYGY